jgi:hypothetical protein
VGSETASPKIKAIHLVRASVRHDGSAFQFAGRTGPDRRPLYNFDQRSLVSLSVTVGIKVDISVVLKRVLKKNQISISNCLEPGGSLKVFHPPKLGALFYFANFQIPGT